MSFEELAKIMPMETGNTTYLLSEVSNKNSTTEFLGKIWKMWK